MHFISVREMRSGSSKLWSQLQSEGEVILTLNGKPVAIMAGVTEKNIEQTLKAFRQARAAIAVEEMHRMALRTGNDKITLKEINAEIKAARRKQRT